MSSSNNRLKKPILLHQRRPTPATSRVLTRLAVGYRGRWRKS